MIRQKKKKKLERSSHIRQLIQPPRYENLATFLCSQKTGRHLGTPAPVVQQILQRPELLLFELRFGIKVSTAMQAFLYGLEKAAPERVREKESER